MGFKDAHDPREFRHLGKYNMRGILMAMVEVADTAPIPANTRQGIYVEMSHPGRADVDTDDAAQAVIASAVRAARVILKATGELAEDDDGG